MMEPVLRKKFIKKAIKHPGALSHDVGGKPSEHVAKVRQLMQHGTPEQKRRAAFYYNVLRPINKAAARNR